MSKKYTMHVISGTHWDREWRHTAEQSKLRLMDLMDEIIDLLESNEAYKYFCVDGGMIVLEDYLTVRPENKNRIKKLILAERMQVVRWYTLPETFTVAPEAIIRNLLLGSKIAEEYGGGIESGYTATSYGQVSQMPQIYLGFGLTDSMFYRGTNKYELPQVFLWESPDGSQILTHKTFDFVTRTNWFFYVHQPLVLRKPFRDLNYYYNRKDIPVHLCDEGLYERAFRLQHEDIQYNNDPKELKRVLEKITAMSMPYAVGNHLLALNMEDNAKPFSLMPEMIKEMNDISPDIEIVQSSLDEYFNVIKKETEGNLDFVHRGELRYGTIDLDSWNGLYGNTHSSRIKLKIINDRVETNLLYLAEPLAAIASAFGAEYPKTVLNRAWEAVLKNHAHDSICGAAVDLAHEDMLYNFSIANTVAEEVSARGLISLFSRIDTAGDFNKGDYTITLFNTMNKVRKEIVPVVIDVPIDILYSDYFDIVDSNGNLVEYELLSAEKISMSVERELDTNSGFPAMRRRILISAELPPMGFTSYALRHREPRYIIHTQAVLDKQPIARGEGVLENDYLKVTINHSGTFDIYQKKTGRVMQNMHYFTDEGSIGDAHIMNRPKRNPLHTSIGSSAKVTMIESGFLRGIFQIDLSISVPAAATLDGRDRLREMVEIPISYMLTLDKEGKYLKIKTKLNNKARDHKLRVNFPSGVQSDFTSVESAFAVEKRSILRTETGNNLEGFYPYQPMQNFVDVNDGSFGLAILNKGLREYEVMDDKQRTIAITLLRTHRAYMTATKDMTPEEFDKYTGLHSFGDMEFSYAVYPHNGDWQEGEVLQEAYRHKIDIKAILGVPVKGELNSKGSFLTINPSDKVMISALKQSEDGKGIILRVWNTSNEKLCVDISTIMPVKTVKQVRMDESIVSEVCFDSGKMQIEMGPNKIETLLLTC